MRLNPLTRADKWFIGLLVVLSVLRWYPLRHGPLELQWDAGAYYILGTSLAEGKGYSLLNEPGEIRANQYPPLLPLIVAVHQKIAGTNDPFTVGRFLKVSAIVSSALVNAAVYVLLRWFLPPLWARCGALMYLICLPAILYSVMLTAELPMTAGLVTFLLIYYKMHSTAGEVAAGAAAGAAFLARTASVAIFVAWIGQALLQRQFRRAALRSTIAALFMIPWYGWVHYVESTPEYRNPPYAYQRAGYMYPNVSYARNMKYLDPFRPELGAVGFRDLLDRVVSSVRSGPSRLGETVTSHYRFWEGQARSLQLRTGLALPTPALAEGIRFLIGATVLAGIVLLTMRGHWLIGLYIAATFTSVSLTPWPEQYVRYFTPSTPVLVLGFCTSLYTAVESFRRKSSRVYFAARAAALCLVGIMLAQAAAAIARSYTRYLVRADITDRAGRPVVYNQLYYQLENAGLDECITWIRQTATRVDIVATARPHWVYLRTGLKSVIPPLDPDPVKINGLLASVPVRYGLLEGPQAFTTTYLSRALEDNRQWKLVYRASSADVRVYERIPQ